MSGCTVGLIMLYMSFFAAALFVVSVCISLVLLIKHRNKRKYVVASIISFSLAVIFGILGSSLWHSWEVNNTIEASCTEMGLIEHKCTKCGTMKSETISELGHDWLCTNNLNATCEKGGFVDYKCERCNEVKAETLEALGHDWAEATCTDPKTCNRCGKNEGDVLGHNWENATCNNPKQCSRCGETKGKAIEHSYFENEYDLIWSCMSCGDIYVVNDEELYTADSKTVDECTSVIKDYCIDVGLENIDVTIAGYIDSPATFYYYSINCDNMSDFENREIYTFMKDCLDSFSVDFNHYELINITCDNDVYIFDRHHEKLIKNGEYCYDPYKDSNRETHADAPYIGMDADYINETELGHYDNLEYSDGPRRVLWYEWSLGGELIFKATVIDGEVTSTSDKRSGTWISKDKGDEE